MILNFVGYLQNVIVIIGKLDDECIKARLCHLFSVD